jgi:hypothetical protein
MKKQSKEKREEDMRQVMAEERSRGRSQPVHALSIEMRRRIHVAARLLSDKNCDKRQYMAIIRDDFGLPDGSPEFLQYMKAWDESH